MSEPGDWSGKTYPPRPSPDFPFRQRITSSNGRAGQTLVISNVRRVRQKKIETSRRPVSERCGERCTRLKSATRAPSQSSEKSLILGRNQPVQRPADVGKTSTGRRQAVSVAVLSPTSRRPVAVDSSFRIGFHLPFTMSDRDGAQAAEAGVPSHAAEAVCDAAEAAGRAADAARHAAAAAGRAAEAVCHAAEAARQAAGAAGHAAEGARHAAEAACNTEDAAAGKF
eukprot:gene12081-biopygen4740